MPNPLVVLGIVIPTDFDLWWQVLNLCGWLICGWLGAQLLLFSEQYQPYRSIKAGLRGFWRQVVNSWNDLFSRPKHAASAMHIQLWFLRLGVLSNLTLWLATTSCLTSSRPSIDAHFWGWHLVNTLLTIVLFLLPSPADAPSFLYGKIKQGLNILAFSIIFGLAVLSVLALSSTRTITEILSNQSRPLFGYFNAWYIWSNPLILLLAAMVFYDCVITFQALNPLPRQFEQNYHYQLTQHHPQLSTHLAFLRTCWKLNIITLFVAVFMGGGWGLIHIYRQPAEGGNPLFLLFKVLFLGWLLFYWQQKTIEYSTNQFMHFHFKILLPIFTGVLWLIILFL